MSFHYSKSGHHGQSESFWTSNSDLFLGLSSIFLLLYVVSSLRSGADGVNNANENKKLKVQIQDLQNQLKTYESVKDQYLQSQATKSEKDEYVELMDKLTLLQEEAKNEKDSLAKQAQDHAKKENALNKYQQMVRNIINSNKMAQTKISNRNEVITEKEEVIDEKNDTITAQTGKITNLNQDIAQKENLIKNKDNQIDQINDHLSQKMKELKRTYKQAKLSQKAYQLKMKQLQNEADQKVSAIEEQKLAIEKQKKMTFAELQKAKNNLNQTKAQLEQTSNQLQNTKGELDTTKGQLSSTKGQLEQTVGELDQTQGQLNSTKGQLEKTRGQLDKKSLEIANLSNKLGSAAADTKAKMDALNAQFNADRAAEKAAFEGALRKQKNLSESEIARREGQFKAEADAKQRKMAGEMAGLAGQLKNTEGQLNAVKAELQARKKIAQEIKKGFDKIGVKADIDLESGDVLLDFGQAYFDNDSAQLKADMQNVLKKAMPIYSKSLFGNPAVSSQISAVEVIGFASPTYQGKFVDPNSTKSKDLEALKYNMDLSYKRAKSIFNYILDEKEMNFEHRKTLVPTLKVSGRSFLDLMKMDRNVASAEDYCKKNDCKKAQRVIIRFSMDKKK
jgi:chromosome segregation ATPase